MDEVDKCVYRSAQILFKLPEGKGQEEVQEMGGDHEKNVAANMFPQDIAANVEIVYCYPYSKDNFHQQTRQLCVLDEDKLGPGSPKVNCGG